MAEVGQQALGGGDSHMRVVEVVWAGWQQRMRASADSLAQSYQYLG